MKKKFDKAKEVFKIKNHLYRVAPNISNVEIKIKQLKSGRFKTQISAHIPTRKNIISSKVNSSLSDALEKAHKAVLKQINKTNKRGIRRQTIRKIVLDEAA